MTLKIPVNAKKRCFPVTKPSSVVNKCPGVKPCQNNFAFDKNCDCKCIEKKECRPGLQWDSKRCKCVEIDCPGQFCGGNYVFDGNCNCQCGIDKSFCQPNEIFDASGCSCNRNWGCDYSIECPLGEIWDYDVCGCITNKCPTKNACQGNYLFDPDCNCQCALTQDICLDENLNFNSANCICAGNVCPDKRCAENRIMDPQTCNCDCVLTEENCPIHLPVLNKDACQCQVPNYVTTPSPPTSPSQACERKVCRNRYVWLQQVCDCVCPPIFCEIGTIRGNDCNCIPDPNN